MSILGIFTLHWQIKKLRRLSFNPKTVLVPYLEILRITFVTFFDLFYFSHRATTVSCPLLIIYRRVPEAKLKCRQNYGRGSGSPGDSVLEHHLCLSWQKKMAKLSAGKNFLPNGSYAPDLVSLYVWSVLLISLVCESFWSSPFFHVYHWFFPKKKSYLLITFFFKSQTIV